MFRKQVISAKVNAPASNLTDYMRKYNFENLVDVVNKVDYLARNGFLYKMKESPDDKKVLEYYEQLKRVKIVYINIDVYYNNYHYGNPYMGIAK